jgi:hypothetical protein
MAHALNAAELLEVGVHELAETVALIAHDASRGLRAGQAAQTEAAQLASDSG